MPGHLLTILLWLRDWYSSSAGMVRTSTALEEHFVLWHAFSIAGFRSSSSSSSSSRVDSNSNLQM